MFLTFLLAQATNPDVADTVEKVTETNVADTAATHSTSIISHLWSGDPVVVMTLWLLIFFSVACWTIIIYKIWQLRSAQTTSQNFWQQFSMAQNPGDLIGNKGLRDGPLFEIFSTGQQTLAKIRKVSNKNTDYHRQLLLQKLTQSREEEMHKLEQYVPFLATTASAAPFIGLFGTVWGILTAFMAIGKAGSSSLATVGPYISEALVATAVGLFAAIPAVIGYNFFVNKIKVITKIVDLFIDDFMIKSESEVS